MRIYLSLIISVFIIACSPVARYQRMAEVLAWENDIQQFEKLDKSEVYSKDAILFMGSSSIRLWSTISRDMAPYPVIQRGFGGSKLSDVAVYADRIVAPHLCKAIVIFVANDITGTVDDKSPEEVARLFRYILKIIRHTHPDAPVFFIAITPTESRWKVWPQIQKANNLVEQICRSNKKTYFIRTDFAFLNNKGKPKQDLFREDKLHLSEQGYEIWTGLIKKELNIVLTNSPRSYLLFHPAFI